MMNGGYKKMDGGKTIQIYEFVKAVAMFFLLILFIDFGNSKNIYWMNFLKKFKYIFINDSSNSSLPQISFIEIRC